MKIKMKKAQTEIIGLVVIVTIIIIAVVLFVRLAILKPASHSPTSVESIEANNMLNALLKTTVCDISIQEAIQQCSQKINICDQEPRAYTVGKIKEILQVSLDEKTDYSFIALSDNSPLIKIENCETGISASPFSLPSRGAVYTINFKLCGKNM